MPTKVFDANAGESYKPEPDIPDEVATTDEGIEPVSITVVDVGRFKRLNDPAGAFGVIVPKSWSYEAERQYDDDGAALYTLRAAPDIEEFQESYIAPGIQLLAAPMFDGYQCTRETIDAIIDWLSPTDTPDRDGRSYHTTGIIWKKAHFGAESWFTNDDETQQLQIWAGRSPNGRWLYALLLQGIEFDRKVSSGDVVDERSQEKIVESIFA